MTEISKRFRLLLLGAALCGAAWLHHRQDRGGSAHWLPASVPSAVAAAAPAAPAPSPATPTALDRPAWSPRVGLGDRALAGEIDLSRATLESGRYSVPLYDGRAILTLDPALQSMAEQTLARAQAPLGAIVVIDTDGRILALAGNRDGEQSAELPVSVWAPAASVFKIVTTAALVAAGVQADTVTCFHGGRRSITAEQLKDDPARDSKCENLSEALAQSQNAVIAKLADRHLSRRDLAEFAAAFGFNSAPEFALDTEPSRVTVPADRVERARVAAGFWNSELSPLGGALLANTIATRGMRVTPRIVDAIETRDGAVRELSSVPPQRALAADIAKQLSTMMRGTTESGTAYKGFHDRRGAALMQTSVAGKTGSLTRSSPSFLGYSWFVGFAPADKPEVSVAVLLGNEPRWHLKAHTAARLVLDARFR